MRSTVQHNRRAVANNNGHATVPPFRNGDARLRGELVASYQPLARSLAAKYMASIGSYVDAVSVANVGLLKALNQFDAGRQTAFGTYARPIIEGELRHYVRDQESMIRIPRHIQSFVGQVHRATEALSQRYGRFPTALEVAKHLKVSEKLVAEAHRAARLRQPRSMDAMNHNGANGSSDWACLSNDTHRANGTTGFDDVRKALKLLDNTSRTLIIRRYWDGWSQSRIAKELGTTQSTVSRRINLALRRLRRLLDNGEHQRADDPRTSK